MKNQTETTVRRRQRIILFPLPYQGHINPMLQLANLLHSKGFSITILHTNFNKPKTSNYPHFTFRFILDNDPHDERYSNLPLQGMGAFNRLFVFNEHGHDELRHELKLLLATEEDEQVSCIITDALWHFTQSVADSLNLPRLVLRTCSLFCFLAYASLPVFDDLGYLNHADPTRLDEQVAGFPVLKVKDIIKLGFKSSKDPIGLMLSNMVKQTKASSGIIWNSFKELEEPELETVCRDIRAPSFLIPFPKHFTASSSSLLDQDRTFFPWLDHQPPNSIEPLPDGFVGELGRIVKWAPQQEVLAHEAIGAFWTHSGWNSTLESVCEGVAMILLPFMGDQALNARYMSDVSKVGVYFGNVWERREIADAVRRVMVDEDIRENARVLKQKANVSSMKGGSSYESLESLDAYISSF
ncbi:hypothetical protein L1987_35895 [Smallanthus sonchifolius]|uniref:Uncharacterized protein n=1 Tax=Smallanthus sonchifolius TaxID=185202 RepID=A0ACB9HC33_9ASTR|nr:hypothetical protein L1987_35895 [Smallanthus sonchifolius]